MKFPSPSSEIGGNLIDRDQADSESGMLDMILDILKHTGSKYMMYSGLKDSDPALVTAEIEKLNWITDRCLERDVQLLYHNHHWEFFDLEGTTAWDLLLANASPQVKLCPDIGWLHKAGVNLIEFMQTYQDRIGTIHFKDFAALDPDLRDTVVLGDGCVPLTSALDWIETNFNDMWIISEQDFTDLAPADAILANAKFFAGGE